MKEANPDSLSTRVCCIKNFTTFSLLESIQNIDNRIQLKYIFHIFKMSEFKNHWEFKNIASKNVSSVQGGLHAVAWGGGDRPPQNLAAYEAKLALSRLTKTQKNARYRVRPPNETRAAPLPPPLSSCSPMDWGVNSKQRVKRARWLFLAGQKDNLLKLLLLAHTRF